MKNSLFLFIITGVLSVSILAPSVCTLLEISIETSLVQETDEESKKEKTEKDLEEKLWDTHRSDSGLWAFWVLSNNNYESQTTDRGIGVSEVTAPPPEGSSIV